jgi:hypothetical protein
VTGRASAGKVFAHGALRLIIRKTLFLLKNRFV